jgi:hypothetical protein
MLGFTEFGRLVDGVSVVISNLSPTVFSDCAVIVYMMFNIVFMCPKIMKKLYLSNRFQYLSFGIEINFIALVV